MSYKTPLASTTQFGLVKVGTGLSVTDGVVSTNAGASDFGFITGNTTQLNPVASQVNIVNFATASPAQGVTITGGNAITVTNPGTYSKFFTLIMSKTAGGVSSISIWLRLNGVDVVGSRQDLELINTLASTFVSGNYTLNLAAGSNIQLCWSSADTTVSITSLPAATVPTRPSGYSAKITLTRIA